MSSAVREPLPFSWVNRNFDLEGRWCERYVGKGACSLIGGKNPPSKDDCLSFSEELSEDMSAVTKSVLGVALEEIVLALICRTCYNYVIARAKIRSLSQYLFSKLKIMGTIFFFHTFRLP